MSDLSPLAGSASSSASPVFGFRILSAADVGAAGAGASPVGGEAKVRAPPRRSCSGLSRALSVDDASPTKLLRLRTLAAAAAHGGGDSDDDGDDSGSGDDEEQDARRQACGAARAIPEPRQAPRPPPPFSVLLGSRVPETPAKRTSQSTTTHTTSPLHTTTTNVTNRNAEHYRAMVFARAIVNARLLAAQ